jgi:hypothetical protein
VTALDPGHHAIVGFRLETDQIDPDALAELVGGDRALHRANRLARALVERLHHEAHGAAAELCIVVRPHFRGRGGHQRDAE